ncbi:MAG TPA: GNAT family N-acetyltransferase [Pyrinomonadaceae bacterium]
MGPPFCFTATSCILPSPQIKQLDMQPDNFRIESASVGDIPLLVTFIKELASYEKLLQIVNVTEDRLRIALFGLQPRAHAVIGYCDQSPVAFAIYFFNFSTFEGLPGLYIEDIFVRPAFRGSGFGRRLFEFLAQRARQENCSRVELSVLNWNEHAIQFYKRLGGEPVTGWTVFRFPEKVLNNFT